MKLLCHSSYHPSLVPTEPWSPWAGRTDRHEGPEPWQTSQETSPSLSRLSSELWGVGGASWPDLSSSVPLRPLCERRKLLYDNMVEIPNRIMFSEMKQVTVSEDPTLAVSS